jgi:glycine/D-amino acid oxidase-like deaminating enzyme
MMGAATALFLARDGARVTLFDAATVPCAGASRWNEGKIHLGHLYAADPSLRTAQRLLPGGLAFRRLVEALVGRSIDEAISTADDVYLVHRTSVVAADDADRYYDAVTALAAGHPDARSYLASLAGARPRRLTSADLDAICDTACIVAGFRVPERSVSTRWIADRLVEALHAEPRITLRLGTTLTGVESRDAALAGPFVVHAGGDVDGPFDAVVNALWQGRLVVDATAGLPVPATWSHRYRVSVFLRTRRPVALAGAVIATGPFGDVKNYNGHDFYLSWYTTGLRVEGGAVAPPAVPDLDPAAREALADEVMARLSAVMPGVAGLAAVTESRQVAGGWVYAVGRGALDDRQSTLHRRDRAGIVRRGNYVSVDTGKYSIAPWLARSIADDLA